ncbi:hypothetical protein GO988_04565 [Hymenobacter sp. HMF4947]|uniref:NlpC/P60 domain-containing protein n=1 Tax=Hymenobacter ginkgonis TaxID=2682976 RepID=A0A7K1TBA8_9BACT|nr:C40 family peptidase [Hymenobacter ginkgonis]MVN75592.1 hypothetical protein [Hymenobacter ginkgonis]
MRAIWLIFGTLLAAVLVGGWLYRRSATSTTAAQPTAPAALPVLLVAERRAALPSSAQPTPRADSIVRFALAQAGTRYTYAGISPATGFDCSGFIQYVFGRFGVPTSHSTALLIDAGQPVGRAQAQPGDIVVFTGTAATSTTPGHAGIVISALGETPLRFVHASSAARESGVKVSQVEGSGYERRFMQVRRVLSNGPAGRNAENAAARSAAARAVMQATVHPAGAVAALPLPPAEAVKAVITASHPPTRVAPLPVRAPAPRASQTTAKRKAYPPPAAPAHKMAPTRRPASRAKPTKPAPRPATKAKPSAKRRPAAKAPAKSARG